MKKYYLKKEAIVFYSKNHYQWKENDFKYETIIIFTVSAADTYYTEKIIIGK